MLSVIPDIDILFPMIQHRGPTHSIIAALIVFIPFFVAYRKEAVPYFVAMIQHSLVGDYIAGGKIQLLWPLTTRYFGTNIEIRSPLNVTIEWISFAIAIIVMLKTRDIITFFRPQTTNLILAIPTFTVLLPTFLSYPLYVPALLIPPHLAYMSIFSIAIVIQLRSTIRSRKR